jgi:tyrosyl-tRNA synthetase
LLDLLVAQGFIASKGEGRRLVQQNAIKRDDETVSDPLLVLQPASPCVLKVGKRRFLKLL